MSVVELVELYLAEFPEDPAVLRFREALAELRQALGSTA